MRQGHARGFAYALEPARNQREWKLASAQMRLAAVQRELSELHALRQQLDDECLTTARRIGLAWASKPDVAAQSGALAWLSQLRQRQVSNQQALDIVSAQLLLARRDCVARQEALDVLDDHRAAALGDFVREEERKFATQADQDHSARSTHAQGGSA